MLPETKYEKQSECLIGDFWNILWKIHIVEYYTTTNMLNEAMDDIWKVRGKAVKTGFKTMYMQYDSRLF